MSEQEKIYKDECYCCDKIKEVRPIPVTESGAKLIRESNKDVNVEIRMICEDCNHIGE